MLNQHKNLLVPESDRLQIGECVIDIPRREVRCPDADDAPRRLTVKALQVLLVLVAHRGQMVSREALLEWVWADTLPGDDVLTQAIAQLRKAFGDDRDKPRYLETIAKGGYRLLAEVSWLPGHAAAAIPMAGAGAPAPVETLPESSATTEPQSVAAVAPPLRRGRAFVYAFVVLAALAALGFAWWQQTHSPTVASATSAPLQFALIAAQPAPEMQPALSPDGSLVAYTMWLDEGGGAIHVQAAEAVPPSRLTTPPEGLDDVMPRWSPNGREIAFMRHGSRHCELMLVPASGGNPRNLGNCPRLRIPQFDWMPDGRGLIAGSTVGEGQGARLSTLDLATGLWAPLRYPAAAGDIDLDPHVSPDGRWIGFRRGISHADLWRMPLAGGKPERLTHLRSNIHGWDWAADGGSIVLAHLAEQTQLSRLDLRTGQLVSLGVTQATWPDMAARAPLLTFARISGQTGLFRRPNPQRSADGKAERLFATSGSDLLPGVSADGRRIAFYSDRTGSSRLWLAEVADPRSARAVEGLRPVPRHPPRWLEDNRTLVVLADPVDAPVADDKAVYTVDSASGRVARMALPAGIKPVIADPMPGRRMLMVVDEGAGMSLRIYDTTARPWRLLASRANVGEARYDRIGGQVWFAQANAPGLWRADPLLRAVQRVDADFPEAYWTKLWTTVDGQAYATRADKDCAFGWRALGGASPSRCLEREIQYGVGEPVLPDDQQWMYYAAAVEAEGSDIALAKLP